MSNFFLTEEPRLFNAETGTMFSIVRHDIINTIFFVAMANATKSQVFQGTYQECEDFIYRLAGHVFAFNLSNGDES